MKVMYKLNILAFEAITKYEKLQYNKSYKEVTWTMHLDILPSKYHEELMAKVIFLNFIIKFFSNDLHSTFICRRRRFIKNRLSLVFSHVYLISNC